MGSHELGLNGDPATPEDIAALETLATGLLEPMPAEYFRQRVYGTAEGSYMLMETCLREEEPNRGTTVLISLGVYDEGGQASPKFAVTFDYDNQPEQDCEVEYEPDEAIMIARELLDNAEPELHPVDRALLKQLKDWATFAACGLEPRHMGVFTSDVAGMQFFATADVIRQRVLAGPEEQRRVKNWSQTFGEREVLVIESIEFVGDVDIDEELGTYPRLEVIYQDGLKQITYVYTRDQLGEAKLKTQVGFEFGEESGDPHTKSEIEEFLDELKANVPGKNDVQLLRDRIGKASQVAAN